MTRTSIAPMRPDSLAVETTMEVSVGSRSPMLHSSGARAPAFTIVELLIVLTILGLMVTVAQVSLFGVLRRHSFHAQVQDFVSTMQMAASRAAESNHRYEVIIDPAEQSYLLREITSVNLADISDEEIIMQGRFGKNCRLVFVEFDDGTYTNEGWAKFRVGHAGWNYGGKIVFIDDAEQSYAVLVNRLTPIIEVVTGDPPLMTPKAVEEVPFL